MQGPNGSNIVTIQGTSSSNAPVQNNTFKNNGGDITNNNNNTGSSSSEPITITRRINVKIQGSMSDFAQDGQGSATWRPVDGKQAAIWGLQVTFLKFEPGCVASPCRTSKKSASIDTRHGEATHLCPFSHRISLPMEGIPPMEMLHPPMHLPPMHLAMRLSSLPFFLNKSLLSRFPLGSRFHAFLLMR